MELGEGKNSSPFLFRRPRWSSIDSNPAVAGKAIPVKFAQAIAAHVVTHRAGQSDWGDAAPSEVKRCEGHRSTRKEAARCAEMMHHIVVVKGCAMVEQNEKMREAEQHLTDELANQSRQEPGSEQEDQAKERRAQAEKEMADARKPSK
jgi:hypothetical protein